MPGNKRLEWSPPAGRDLLTIEAFYAEYSQVTANRAEIRRNALLLQTHPPIGRRGHVSGTRVLVIVKYPFLLVYRIVGRCVRIGRVLHQHQKYPA